MANLGVARSQITSKSAASSPGSSNFVQALVDFGYYYPYQASKITASDPQTGAFFGTSVFVYGNIAVVGAPAKSFGAFSQAGEAYIFGLTSPTSPIQQSIITASDAASSDFFGHSVSVYSTTVVVGAYGKTVSGHANQGSAYVFNTSAGQEAVIHASDGAAGDKFGWSVAVYGNVAVVGAYAKTVGGNANQGRVYVYNITNPTSPVEAIITAADGAANDEFGYAVAIYGNNVIIGAPGKKTVYIYDVTTPSAPVFKSETTVAGGSFGSSVSSYSNTLVVGDPDGDTGGAAYVFDITNPASPVQESEITVSGETIGDKFGTSVSVYGNFAVIGTPFRAVNSHSNQGAAYIFDITNLASPIQEAQIGAIDGAVNDAFGFSVSIYQNSIIIGAETKGLGVAVQQGAAYIFQNPQLEGDLARVTVTGQSWVTSSSKILCSGAALSTADHDPEDVAIEGITAYAENLVAGTGFDIVAKACGDSGSTWGKYYINATGA